jgi:hypothetical protein
MLTLNRLPRKQRAEMIAYVTGGKALPKDIAEQIIDRTDGVHRIGDPALRRSSSLLVVFFTPLTKLA